MPNVAVADDFRPGAGVRISPHFYNTPEEIDRAFSAMDSIVREMQ
ncbi:MAG TPA: hypothetical protein VFW94_01980 [Candidatus Acidoferrales bacterium]|nr:hypothetical protein [Candidatus Acidoferrales bacterium]